MLSLQVNVFVATGKKEREASNHTSDLEHS